MTQITHLLEVFPYITTSLSQHHRFVNYSNIQKQITNLTQQTYKNVRFDKSTIQPRIFEYSDLTESKCRSLNVAFFALASALSFPSISACPGIHDRAIWSHGRLCRKRRLKQPALDLARIQAQYLVLHTHGTWLSFGLPRRDSFQGFNFRHRQFGPFVRPARNDQLVYSNFK